MVLDNDVCMRGLQDSGKRVMLSVGSLRLAVGWKDVGGLWMACLLGRGVCCTLLQWDVNYILHTTYTEYVGRIDISLRRVLLYGIL